MTGVFVVPLCRCGAGGFILAEKGWLMMAGEETRVALIGIMVGSKDSVAKLNQLLHEYSEYIVGRMGIPYQKRNVSVISIVLDAPNDVISALSGKLGMLPQVNTKTVYAKIPQASEEDKE